MLTKQEIYDALKNDGAKLQRAVNFTNRDELVELYKERFGVDPDFPDEQPNTEKLSDGDEMQHDFPDEQSDETDLVIPLLKFDESGWCTALDRAYSRGLYRPASREEYIALRKYAAEEIEA